MLQKHFFGVSVPIKRRCSHADNSGNIKCKAIHVVWRQTAFLSNRVYTGSSI